MEQSPIDSDEVPMVIHHEEHDSGSDRTETRSDWDSSLSSEQNDDVSDSDTESSDSSCSAPDPFGAFTRNEMTARLNERSSEYDNIRKLFAAGMGPALAGESHVAAVHKSRFSGINFRARFETFRLFSKAVAEKYGGDGNVRYAWYGGGREEIAEILDHGFSSRNGDDFGRVKLVPAKLSLDGALDCGDVDEDGMRHMLLCRVILGKSELVLSGCGGGGGYDRSVPSSNEFDSGVDSCVNPRRYFVWSAFMNSHICPAYVVSFKAPYRLESYATNARVVESSSSSIASALTQGSSRGIMGGSRRPVTLTGLLAGLTRFLAPREMTIIVQLLSDFKAKKITGEQLKHRARLIAGDKLILAMKLMATTVNKENRGEVDGSVRDIYLPGLINVLASFLPAPKTNMLMKSLNDYRANRITRLQLTRSVRVVVGDDNVLIAAVNSYRSSKQRRQQQGIPQV